MIPYKVYMCRYKNIHCVGKKKTKQQQMNRIKTKLIFS